MQRGTKIARLRGAGAIAAAATAMSCGAGLHSPENWLFVSKNVDQNETEISLGEGTLKLQAQSLSEEALNASSRKLTLGRHEQYKHGGAVGPVFEVNTPSPNFFIRAPTLTITTRPEVANDPNYVLAYVHPTDKNFEQWTPDMSDPPMPRSDRAVSGLVQLEDFTNPGGIRGNETKDVRLAIVKLCSGVEDCDSGQECSSGCCQACVTGGPCHR